MSFASIARELRRYALTMLKTHRDEFSDFLPRSYSHSSPHTSSSTLSHFSHETNHRSYGFGSRDNNFVSRRLGYGPRTHRGDHSRVGLIFLLEGLIPTGSNSEVLKTVKTFYGRMVK
jgi:hypothetical protein